MGDLLLKELSPARSRDSAVLQIGATVSVPFETHQNQQERKWCSQIFLMQLTEAFIGTLTNRVICGKVLTANAQMNTSNGSGNEQFGQLATSISMGQMCVGEADNAALDARVQKQAQQIVSSANVCPLPVAL